MRWKKLTALAFAGALAVAGTACSDDEVGSRQDVVDGFMEDQGLSQEMAECLADAAIEEFGLETMNERRDLTAEEQDAVTEFAQACVEEVGLENVEADTDPATPEEMEDLLDDSSAQCDLLEGEAKDICLESIAEMEDMLDEG